MKRIFIALFFCLLWQSLFAYDFSAESPSGHTLYYSFVTGGVSVVSPDVAQYSDGVITIPDSVTYNGIAYAVKAIDDSAFCDYRECTSVTIPNTVTSIGNSAFSGCNLTYVIIPESVVSLGSKAFYRCTSLRRAIIGNSVTSIGDQTFYNCVSLFAVTIGNSVTSIGKKSFYFCYYLSSVTMGNSVTTIGDSAFSRCFNLNTISLPNTLTTIGDYAFYDCEHLSTVTIHSSVDSIGSFAFGSLDTVFMMPSVPPRLGHNAFDAGYSGPVFILGGCYYDAYINFGINDFGPYSLYGNVVEPSPNVHITVSSSDSLQGTANVIQRGGHDVRCDSTTIVSAEANLGYHFSHWSNGNTANPDTIQLTGDSTITAFFARNIYHLTVSISDSSHGTVLLPLGDSAFYGDTLMIVANPVTGYHMSIWGEDSVSANNDTAWVYMTDNRIVNCYFEPNLYTVTVSSNDIIRGTASASDNIVAYGHPCTVIATAYTGYTFHSWSNGVTANPYTFAVMNDVELTAIFLTPDDEVYTVTVNSNDPTMGTATVNGNASATATPGTTVTLMATPNDGYHFTRWNDNDTMATRTITVNSNMSFMAYFEADSTQGIDDVWASELVVYTTAGRIHVAVDGQAADSFSIYDVMGRCVATMQRSTESPELPAGVYLVKVGTLPARKVVVVK